MLIFTLGGRFFPVQDIYFSTLTLQRRTFVMHFSICSYQSTDENATWQVSALHQDKTLFMAAAPSLKCIFHGLHRKEVRWISPTFALLGRDVMITLNNNSQCELKTGRTWNSTMLIFHLHSSAHSPECNQHISNPLNMNGKSKLPQNTAAS